MERIKRWVSSVGGYLALNNHCEEDLVSVKLPQSISPKKKSRNKPAIRMLQTCEVEKSILLPQKFDEPHNGLNQDSSSEEKETEPKPPAVNEFPSKGERKQFKSVINKPSNITRPIGFHNEELKHASARPIFPAKNLIARPASKEQKHNTYYQPNQLSSASSLARKKVLEKLSEVEDSHVISIKLPDNPKEEDDSNKGEKPVSNKNAATQYISRRKMEEARGINSAVASSGKPVNVLQKTHMQRIASNVLGVSATSRVFLRSIGEEYVSQRLINPQ